MEQILKTEDFTHGYGVYLGNQIIDWYNNEDDMNIKLREYKQKYPSLVE